MLLERMTVEVPERFEQWQSARARFRRYCEEAAPVRVEGERERAARAWSRGHLYEKMMRALGRWLEVRDQLLRVLDERG